MMETAVVEKKMRTKHSDFFREISISKQKKEILTYEILQQHKHEQQCLIAAGLMEKPKMTDDVFTPEQEREFNRGITLDDILEKYKMAI